MAKFSKDEHPVKTFGWAARDTSGFLSPFNFSRRAAGEKDVRLKVLYCGICHTDLHDARNDWGITKYPVVPGVINTKRRRSVGKICGGHGSEAVNKWQWVWW